MESNLGKTPIRRHLSHFAHIFSPFESPYQTVSYLVCDFISGWLKRPVDSRTLPLLQNLQVCKNYTNSSFYRSGSGTEEGVFGIGPTKSGQTRLVPDSEPQFTKASSIFSSLGQTDLLLA